MGNKPVRTVSANTRVSGILVPPYPFYSYFEDADGFPFDPHAQGMPACNAWRLAEASQLAYERPNLVRSACLLAGFDDVAYFENGSTQCYLAVSGMVVPGSGFSLVRSIRGRERVIRAPALGRKPSILPAPGRAPFAILAFRGTAVSDSDRFLDIMADVTVDRVPFGNGHAHKGFLHALNSVWKGKPSPLGVPWAYSNGLGFALERLFAAKPGLRLFIMGHSLGGALATLAAALEPRCAALCTFGSPMAADAAALSAPSAPCYRYTNGNDPVPGLPPPVLMEKLFGYHYDHAGTHCRIHGDGSFSVDPPGSGSQDALGLLAANVKDALAELGERMSLPNAVRSALRAATGAVRRGRTPFVDDLNDHASITYIERLKRMAALERGSMR
ncbi:MAG: hypothetical protein NT080_04590 [Spirochaetes bacterium]|nr:hypothetical protein [Spirochaetota bacterium]